MEPIKKWYFSKTVILALAQGIIGVIVAIQTVHPDLQQVGVLAIWKSAIDLVIRLNTDTAIN